MLNYCKSWLVAGFTMAFFVSACTSAKVDLKSRGTEIAAEIFGTQTAEAPAISPTPLPTRTLTITPTPSPTATPSPIPTATAQPSTATASITPTPGPYVFQDDLSRNTSAWAGCEACTFRDGVLHMGPYPSEGAYLQHNVICGACGAVRNYRMSVDVYFAEGVSDRGFGLLLRLTDEYMLTMEITPWQTVDVWRFEFKTETWEWVNGYFSGLVRPNQQRNRVETDVRPALAGSGMTSDIYIKVNGKTVFVVYNQPAEFGLVGLTLFGHSTEVVFDNFEFETDDLVIPIPPNLQDELQG